MSQSSDSSEWVEPGSPSDAASAIYRDVEEFSAQQSMTNSNDADSEEDEYQSVAKVPQPDSEEVEQQSKADPHDDSSLDLLLSSRLSAIANAESLKERILESQTIVTEFGQAADPHSCADVADCDEQGVRVFTPRNFSFQELLNSNAAGCLNSDWSEFGAPYDTAPSDAAANEVEKRIPDHSNNDWKEWLINRDDDV